MRSTGRIFNIILDWMVERVKGGKLERLNVTLCRWDSRDVMDRSWHSVTYPTNGRPLTHATRVRLLRAAPLAMANRR